MDSTLCELIIEGNLDAQGTAAQPISISSSYEGAWWGIRFKQGSGGLLKHAVVEYGYCGVLADSGSTVTIDSCTIQKNEIYGIRCDHTDGATTISGNRIWNNGVYGIWVEHCTPLLQGNFISNSTYGIMVKYSDMLIEDNWVYGELVRGMQFEDASPTLLANRVTGSVSHTGIACLFGSNPHIKNCEVNTPSTYGLACLNGSDPTVDSTTITSYKSKGVLCSISSRPKLGDTGEGSGYNNIYSPEAGYDVWCNESYLIMAENCWWGMAPPDSSRFYGKIDYEPWLDHEVGVKPTPQPHLPEHFSLAQNYPNPFNPTTVIRYSLPVARQGRSGEGGSRARTTSTSYVSLKVYNILGQEVRTLVDEPQAPGYYQVRWDGRDNLGRELASGIYFYRLKAESRKLKAEMTRKMVLIR